MKRALLRFMQGFRKSTWGLSAQAGLPCSDFPACAQSAFSRSSRKSTLGLPCSDFPACARSAFVRSCRKSTTGFTQHHFCCGKSGAGFTLPEMLVAFTIFSMVISVTSAVFLNVSRSYRIASGFFNAQQTMRYAMELMTYEVKEGAQYEMPTQNQFRFTDENNKSILYFVNDEQLMRKEDAAAPIPFTDTRLRVTGFSVVIPASNPGVQPRVTFLITIAPKTDTGNMGDLAFTLQTTITQRKITF
ncbi:MAG: hypothetical protein COZ64_00800 [Candidatus Brennerbacteria bacterium CG_4_8_14_3_um_filter_43_14]|uniref:Prepilin-type N-terminal cleavage/methylation domain-containing protein n=1 Tax=Candidatus Brennerbacteria bacterium CG_4_8_14_3_um_filter_43_14 TaxID=1974521 RepID=A0A2H9N5N1_9BACT|nr:MAG: hypothetical protein COZ64_00800 [Candidatus Brennerbacteria bacterium CG_4_8_14_3_um_filter_43_14]